MKRKTLARAVGAAAMALGATQAMATGFQLNEQSGSGLSLAETSRDLARAGIRQRHPEYSADEVESAMLRLVLGDDLYRRAWPSRPVLAP